MRLIDVMHATHPHIESLVVKRAHRDQHLDGDQLEKLLYLIKGEADYLLRWKHGSLVHTKQKAGKPRDERIHDLNRSVARALHESAIKVTRGRDGTFARVLELVRKSIDRPLGRDPFAEIKEAADWVHERPFDKLEKMRERFRASKLHP